MAREHAYLSIPCRLYRLLDEAASVAGWLSWPAFMMIFTSGVSPWPWLCLSLFWLSWRGLALILFLLKATEC